MTKKQKLKIVDEAIRLVEIGKYTFSCHALVAACSTKTTYGGGKFEYDFFDVFLVTGKEHRYTFSGGNSYGLNYNHRTELGKRTRLIALELFKCMIKDGSI